MSQRVSSAAHRTRRPAFESFEQALACHAQGRLPDAEELYRCVLEADERHFGAVHGLGLIRLQQGRFADATSSFRRAIKIDRNSGEAHHHLAVALTGLGRPEEAIERFEKALALKPDFAEAHDSLGHALQVLGRTTEAISHHERAISIKAEYAEAHNNLGSALYRLGRSERAIPKFQRALALRPQYAEAHNNLGLALAAVGEHDEAIAHYRSALAINADYAEAHINLGNLLLALGRSEEAIMHSQRALALKPNHLEALNNLGDAFRAVGRLQSAVEIFDKVVTLAPKKAGNYWNLAGCKRFTAADPHLAAMKALAKDIVSLAVEDQIGLHFALGKAFADLGDHSQAAHHLLRGNSLKRQQISYDEKQTLQRFERIRAVFTPELIRDKHGLGVRSSLPIFIIGMPRSGTTLMEQILASHAKVFGAGELYEMGQIAKTMSGANGTAFPDAIAIMSAEQLRDCGMRYLRALGPSAASAERVTDKMPHNFPYVGLIHLLLPNARIIYARRDPRDVALSCFSLLFGHGQMAFSYDLAELGRYYRAHMTLMQHWRNVIPAEVMLDVQYEELVNDLEGQARRIVAHCGLEWDDTCLTFYKTERAVRTASVTQVRQPIYHSSVERWRPYEELLRPFVEAAGDLTSTPPPH